MSEDENELQRNRDENVREARRRRRRESFKDNMWIIFWILVVAVIVGSLCWISYADISGYRRECHNAGGHVVEVRGYDICVDRENKVIFL